MTALDAVFKAYDVRGTVPEQLDGRSCRAIGWAFARFAGHPPCAGGPRHARRRARSCPPPSPPGPAVAGADVVDLGLASTDMMYFASGRLDAPGAMFTASHNPAGYNGIKMCLAGAKPVGQDTGLADIRDGAEEALPSDADDGPETGGYERHEMLDEYAAHVRSFIDVAALRPLKVVADTANGMGGLVVPTVFEGLPVDAGDPLRRARRHLPQPSRRPHPGREPPGPEGGGARAPGADIGLAFDGDADRVFLVDEKARAGLGIAHHRAGGQGHAREAPRFDGALQPHLLQDRARDDRATTGAHPVRTRVGHSFIKQVMADTGAVFGGEHSGHYYFRDNYRADSGPHRRHGRPRGALRSGRPLSELLAPFRRYADSGEINTEVADRPASVEAMAAHFAADGPDVDRTDGLTVEFGDWWFNVRPSNTEPLLRLNVEAASPAECERHTGELLDLVDEARRGRARYGGTEEHRTPRSAGHAGRHGPESSRISRDPTHHRPPATHHHYEERRREHDDHGTGPAAAGGAGLSRGQGTAHVLRGRGPALQPPPAPQLRVRDEIPVMLVDEAATVDDAEHARLMGGQGRDHPCHPRWRRP